MYVGMYVHMYVGMYVHMYVGMYVHMYVGMYVHMYVGMYVGMYCSYNFIVKPCIPKSQSKRLRLFPKPGVDVMITILSDF
jgi:hypothetical protein